MKNIWKWVLRIAAGVIVLAALAAAGYLWQRNTGFAFTSGAQTYGRTWAGPMMRGHHDFYGSPMGRDFDRSHGRMMGGRADLPYGGWLFPLYGLARLVPLTLAALAIVAAYQIGKRAGINSLTVGGPPAQAAAIKTKTAQTPRTKQ